VEEVKKWILKMIKLQTDAYFEALEAGDKEYTWYFEGYLDALDRVLKKIIKEEQRIRRKKP